MANRFSKKYGNKGLPFNYLRIKDAYQHLMLHHCLKNKQPKLICFQWYISIQVLCTVEEGVANAYI